MTTAELTTELIQERVAMGAGRVDLLSGIIRGVKLLGLESRNGRRYPASTLRAGAALYEGTKVNVNHPKGSALSSRDYQDRLGSIRNVRVEATGLFGDLHFNPKHAVAEQLAWDAEHSPESVGLSHNIEARTSRQDGKTVVEAILKVQSVDLVADPATTNSLYESTSTIEAEPEPADERSIVDRLHDRHPAKVAAFVESMTGRPSKSSLAERNRRAIEFAKSMRS